MGCRGTAVGGPAVRAGSDGRTRRQRGSHHAGKRRDARTDARRAVFFAAVFVALGHLVLVAIAWLWRGARVVSARRGVRIVLVVRGLLGDALFVDVVGLVAHELRSGVVFLVFFGVLLYRDALVHLRHALEFLERVFFFDDDLQLLLLGNRLGLLLLLFGLRRLVLLLRVLGLVLRGLCLVFFRLVFFGLVDGFVGAGDDVEGLAVLPDLIADLHAENGDERAVVVHHGHRVATLGKHVVRTHRGTDPKDQGRGGVSECGPHASD